MANKLCVYSVSKHIHKVLFSNNYSNREHYCICIHSHALVFQCCKWFGDLQKYYLMYPVNVHRQHSETCGLRAQPDRKRIVKSLEQAVCSAS